MDGDGSRWELYGSKSHPDLEFETERGHTLMHQTSSGGQMLSTRIGKRFLGDV